MNIKMNIIYKEMYQTFKSSYITHEDSLKSYFTTLTNLQNDLAIVILRVLEENNQTTEGLCDLHKLTYYYLYSDLDEDDKYIIFNALKRRNFNTDNFIFA